MQTLFYVQAYTWKSVKNISFSSQFSLAVHLFVCFYFVSFYFIENGEPLISGYNLFQINLKYFIKPMLSQESFQESYDWRNTLADIRLFMLGMFKCELVSIKFTNRQKINKIRNFCKRMEGKYWKWNLTR